MQRPLGSDQTIMVLLCEWAYVSEKTGQMELSCFLSKWGQNEKVPCLRKWAPSKCCVCWQLDLRFLILQNQESQMLAAFNYSVCNKLSGRSL